MDKVKSIDDALKEGVKTETIKGDALHEYLSNLRSKHKTAKEVNERESVRASAPQRMADDAYCGIAGQVVRALSPHTEADDQAILLQFLTMFGNVVGSSAHYSVEQTKHGPKLYVLVVGESSKGRKGTSFNQCLSLFEGIDDSWYSECRASGLSSSEGLIHRVRDDLLTVELDEVTGTSKSVISEPGVADKRLLVVESEFTSVLRNFKRDGNKLSHILREAFDGGILSTLVKNSPLKATNSHISIIGHVTKFEMLKHLGEVEIANGFANRFLFCFARRSKILPDGGRLDADVISLLRNQISIAVNQAKNIGHMTRNEDGQKFWAEIYPYLSESDPGMFGAIIGRREALVLRLSVMYALLDASGVISEQHIRSGLAVWEYCEASARYFFGDKLGDGDADDLLAALKESPQGFSRSNIRDFFQRNKSKGDIERVISLLIDRGLAHWFEPHNSPKLLRSGPHVAESNPQNFQ
jgi:hypothetical protein